MQSVTGIVTPSFDVLVAWHPQFALAVLEGVEVRPNLRTVEAVFSSFALNTPLQEAFDTQITGYSIFSGCDITLDPTNAFQGNLFKGLNDVTQGLVTGITSRLMVLSRGEHNYFPIPSQTPLQMVPQVLSRAAGIWHLNSPDNVKMDFTLIATPPGEGPLTVWATFSFLVLGEGGEQFLCLSPRQARAQLRAMGYGGPCCAPPAT